MMAAGLTGSYLHPIPNFEPLTLIMFCSGVLLGVRDGALVGGLTMLVYSLLNPYGAVHPLVMLAQVVGEAAAGAAGGLVARAGVPGRSVAARVLTLAVAGLILTAGFDLITNLATGLVFGQIRATLIGGVPFSLFHIGTNLVVFAAVGAPLVGVLARYRERLSS
ncbi:MAG TPA: hypothetical protein VI792_07875 [Candidatus Eisenbacteria bacterium]